MKKTIACILMTIACASAFIGCNSGAVTPAEQTDIPNGTRITAEQPNGSYDEPIVRPMPRDNDEHDGMPHHRDHSHRRAIRGVKRHFESRIDGTYTVEYIHTTAGTESDDTLDYNIRIDKDNTFSVSIVSNGITEKHNGRWYARRDNIMFFYDDVSIGTLQTEYNTDGMYAERLSNGKIMIYDNNHTIVLSKSPDRERGEHTDNGNEDIAERSITAHKRR